MRAWGSLAAGVARVSVALTAVVAAAALALPATAWAHPLGNFSVSHYTALRIDAEGVTVRYRVDMAEIPTFQEIQETGLVADASHPGLVPYLRRKAETLEEGLRLEVDGRRLALERVSSEASFPPGAGSLPTLKLGLGYRARFAPDRSGRAHALSYRDDNFAGRAGWKEVIATGVGEVSLVASSVPEQDRSAGLSSYPTDLLNSPPQDVEARVVFAPADPRPVVAAIAPPPDPKPAAAGRLRAPGVESPAAPRVPGAGSALAPVVEPVALRANRLGTPRSAFTELVAAHDARLGIVLLALVVAAGLGALHAVEPGHGKTVVGAYLVGSRGTAWHAVWLGGIVTVSHTAGVYLLGGITLYASRYVVPERLYPWLGVISGVTIASVGFLLLRRRYLGDAHGHSHEDDHSHAHGHSHEDDHDHSHAHGHEGRAGSVTVRELIALGVSGGIVPCPAALVVLLSAVALQRVGFGLLLIVAFSAGLAAVLIAVGLLIVHARRFMARFDGGGTLITRWLPLASAAMITLLGVGMAIQALLTAGILPARVS